MTHLTEEYLGRRFSLEALPGDDGSSFVGRFTLLDGLPELPLGDGAAALLPPAGTQDAVHPTLDRGWASENEALGFAREAAHHAIEIAINGRAQGQGNHSSASDRRLRGE